MANNRLWFGNTRNNLCVFLGKDYSSGLYTNREKRSEDLEYFFQLDGEACCSDFVLFTEDSKKFTAGLRMHDSHNINKMIVENEEE